MMGDYTLDYFKTMFLQVGAVTNWCSNSSPETLIPIGQDALGMLCDNIVICYNLKNGSKQYFKADNPHICAGISILTGHSRYPLFAVAEAVLRPKIYVISYPNMEKVTTMINRNNISYIDVKLSEFHYLVTLGQYGDYELAFWDLRTGECLGSAPTYKKCTRFAIEPINVEVEAVMLYSTRHNQMLVYELCRSPSETTIKLLSTTDLVNNIVLSTIFPWVYYTFDRLYIVNDYGEVFYDKMTHMKMFHVWSTPQKFHGPHSLFCSRNGIIVINSEAVYFINNRQNDALHWQLVWTLPNKIGMVKAVADLNNNFHISTTDGNVYRTQYADENVSLVPVIVSHCSIIDYAVVKGNKEEVIVLLVKGGDIRVLEVLHMKVLSKFQIADAISISSHNAMPIVAVGTKTGMVYFLTFEKVRSPSEMASIQISKPGINRMCLFDRSVFIKDDLNGIHIMVNDYTMNSLKLKSSLERESTETWNVFDMFALDEWRAIVFLLQKDEKFDSYANEAWIYSWDSKSSKVNCAEFNLPNNYRSFTVLQLGPSENIDVLALRSDFEVIDIYTVTKNTRMTLKSSFKSSRMGNMTCIMGTRNLLTVSAQRLKLSFRSHKRSKHPYGICRALVCFYEPTIIVKMDEFFKSKYLVALNANGRLKSYRLPLLSDSLEENEMIFYPEVDVIYPKKVGYKNLRDLKIVVVGAAPEEDVKRREKLRDELREIGKAVTELINYDLSVIGRKRMKFQKFCLNFKWLEKLKAEAGILCKVERDMQTDAIADRTRIRDWIFDLIKSKTTIFRTKLRSIFSGVLLESYSTQGASKELLDRYDLFRFYEMEPLEDELENFIEDDELNRELDGDEEEEVYVRKALKRYEIEKGTNVYDHAMAKDFELQDTNIVTYNQLYNEEAKQALIITEALRAEFNKEFILSKRFKQETMDSVLITNATLEKIYSNMNCMLCLLKMEQFVPPKLTSPEWQRDENISKIVTVDDSELKAINRRKKVFASKIHKSDRMLLWADDFWKRALMAMMDGVLEKLWEEEIKKTPQPPEFMLRKKEAEYNLEDQRMYREYMHKLQLLEDDRKKYLRILRDNEVKVNAMKKYLIMKLNEHIALVDQEKLKYDFAIKHERLRLLIMKLTSFKRIESKKQIIKLRGSAIKIHEYILRYEELFEFFERGRIECSKAHEMQIARDRQLDRQFKGNFLKMVPQNITGEIQKIYTRRPKITVKLFTSDGICSEMSRRIVSKKPSKFPLPPELVDFLNLLKTLDDPTNRPEPLDLRHWETFTKLRRQKIDSEVQLRGIMYQTHDANTGKSCFGMWIESLRDLLEQANIELQKAIEEYFDAVHNQRLEIVLHLGQVETGIHHGDLEILKNSVLMNVDDINEINALIKEAGQKKIKSMQRIAVFRRKVKYKEWEHKMTCANIDYLKNVLGLIENCKVNYEFLEVLRNYDKLREMKETTTKVGLIEDIVDQKMKPFSYRLYVLDSKIEEYRREVEELRKKNHRLDSQIDHFRADVTYKDVERDLLGEEKAEHTKRSRTKELLEHARLSRKVRTDYARILELRTILAITRMRTEPMLPPLKPECVAPPEVQ